MIKWADFVITKVQYDSDHSRIIECEVYTWSEDKLINQEHQKRITIVNNLGSSSYITAPPSKNEGNAVKGEVIKGDNVIRYKIDDEYFIRTDGNKTKTDNLGELPEY